MTSKRMQRYEDNICMYLQDALEGCHNKNTMNILSSLIFRIKFVHNVNLYRNQSVEYVFSR